VRAPALALACALAAAPAAADEKEWVLAVHGGASLLHVADPDRSNGDRSAWGGGGGLDVSYGVTDALALRATGTFTGQAIGAELDDMGRTVAPEGAALTWFAGLGLTYTIDILRVVPYLEFAVGALGRRVPTLTGDPWTYDAAVQIGLGLDYLINRRVAVGLLVRYYAALTAIQTLPVYLYFGPRVAIHFGG
jgi:hypothetical protein